MLYRCITMYNPSDDKLRTVMDDWARNGWELINGYSVHTQLGEAMNLFWRHPDRNPDPVKQDS
jgi:hypothetical protein